MQQHGSLLKKPKPVWGVSLPGVGSNASRKFSTLMTRLDVGFFVRLMTFSLFKKKKKRKIPPQPWILKCRNVFVSRHLHSRIVFLSPYLY